MEKDSQGTGNKRRSLLAELSGRKVVKAAIVYAVAAFGVVEILTFVLENFEAPLWITRLVAALFVAGFPVVMLLAWIFDYESGGLHRSQFQNRSSKTIIASSFALLLAGTGVLFYLIFPSNDTQKKVLAPIIDSIAVMPFDDQSELQDQKYLAAGIADSVLDSLSRVVGLKVTARTSALQLAEENADLKTIGRKLNVSAVLRGSLQRSGDTLRISAQLIRVSDETLLWSNTFARAARNVFAVQDEIAGSVVDAMFPDSDVGDDSGNAGVGETTTPEVYELFVKGRYLWQEGALDSVNESVSILRKVVAMDPDFGPGHSQLATALMKQLQRNSTGGSGQPTRAPENAESIHQIVINEADKALAINPDDDQAYYVKAMLNRSVDRSLAKEFLEKVIHLNPNHANAASDLAWIYSYAGNYKKSLELRRFAMERNPMSLSLRSGLARNLAVIGRLDEAQSIARGTISLAEDQPTGYADLGMVNMMNYVVLEGLQANLEYLKRAPGNPSPYFILTFTFLLISDVELYDRWFAHLREQFDEKEPDEWRFYLDGDLQGALEITKQRAEASPESASWRFPYAESLLINKQFAESLEQYRLIQTLHNRQSFPYLHTMAVLELARLAWLTEKLEGTEAAKPWFEELNNLAEQRRLDGMEGGQLAWEEYLVHQAHGRLTDALDSLEQTFELGFSIFHHVYFSPFAETIRNHPRGIEIIERFHRRDIEFQQQIRELIDPKMLDPSFYLADPKRES